MLLQRPAEPKVLGLQSRNFTRQDQNTLGATLPGRQFRLSLGHSVPA
jgi:hypothetical protein